METLHNTNGVVTKLTDGDGGHAPMSPLCLRPCILCFFSVNYILYLRICNAILPKCDFPNTESLM